MTLVSNSLSCPICFHNHSSHQVTQRWPFCSEVAKSTVFINWSLADSVWFLSLFSSYSHWERNALCHGFIVNCLYFFSFCHTHSQSACEQSCTLLFGMINKLLLSDLSLLKIKPRAILKSWDCGEHSLTLGQHCSHAGPYPLPLGQQCSHAGLRSLALSQQCSHQPGLYQLFTGNTLDNKQQINLTMNEITTTLW